MVNLAKDTSGKDSVGGVYPVAQQILFPKLDQIILDLPKNTIVLQIRKDQHRTKISFQNGEPITKIGYAPYIVASSVEGISIQTRFVNTDIFKILKNQSATVIILPCETDSNACIFARQNGSCLECEHSDLPALLPKGTIITRSLLRNLIQRHNITLGINISYN